MKVPDNTPWFVGGAFLLILLYFLSPPFVVAVFGFAFLEAHTQTIEIIYFPAIWLSDNFQPYQYYITNTVQLLGVKGP